MQCSVRVGSCIFNLKKDILMSYKSRLIISAYYRLFFVVLLFSVSILCLGQPVMEHYYGYTMIPVESKSVHDAILSAAILVGILCLLMGVLLFRIMTDRRAQEGDRRLRQIDIDLPDRRSGRDRRT